MHDIVVYHIVENTTMATLKSWMEPWVLHLYTAPFFFNNIPPNITCIGWIWEQDQ